MGIEDNESWVARWHEFLCVDDGNPNATYGNTIAKFTQDNVHGPQLRPERLQLAANAPAMARRIKELEAELGYDKGVTRVDAFRQALRALWTSAADELAVELREHGVKPDEAADFSGHTKDILMALGMEWSNDADDYVFRPLEKKT